MTKRAYKKVDDVLPAPFDGDSVAPDEVLAVTAEPSDDGPHLDENPPTDGHATDLVTVKYIGPNCAVLGGAMILQGETRENVKRSALTLAEKAHPGEFQIIEG